MPSIKELWPDRWLKPEHIGSRRARVVVEFVTVESVYNPRTRKEEPRLVVSFHGKTLRLICNKTQAMSLATITRAEDYTAWPGHEIVLSVGRAPNGSETILISPVPDKPAAPVAAEAGTPQPAEARTEEPIAAGEFAG